MRYSGTITLFSERPKSSQGPYSVVVSIVVHGVALGVLWFGLMHAPKIRDRALNERFTLRHLDLHTPEELARRAEARGIGYPDPKTLAHALSPDAKPAARPLIARQLAELNPGPQTLVQPFIHEKVELTHETPVPTIVIWAPEKKPVETIVPPQPQKQTAANVEPSIDPPNEEVNLSDLGITATDFASKTQPILASTTTPVSVHGPELEPQPPETTSVSQAQPTPAAVVSLSDLRMKEGSVTLPPVNETAAKSLPGGLTPGQPKEPSQATADNAAGKGSQSEAPKGAGESTEKTAAAGSGASQNAANTGPPAGAGAVAGVGNGPSVERFNLPKDGQFGAVVVGAGLDEKYPEAGELWSGRMAYTVYLHVGLAKSWILQYSLPRSAEAAAAGNATRLEAPWPYSIVRPNITAGEIDADALMVHGTVNAAGRFETLAIVFPPQFAEAAFVLSALQQWEFRPAMQSGQITPVEVLLIIPEEPE